MTTKEQIKQILVDYTKKNGISASVVILEDYADELIKHGVILPVRCEECEHYNRTSGICLHFGYYTYYPDVEDDDYCSYGIRRNENGT